MNRPAGPEPGAAAPENDPPEQPDATSPARPPAGRARHRPSFVVGLGGSAGGLAAFEEFFANTPADTGMAFVLVTHLEPHHKTLLPELLQQTTAMTVREIEDGMRVAPNAVYVIPPDRELAIEDDRLRLRPASPRPGPRTPIDAFFRSLARERGPSAIGVVFSGSGSDGALGLAAIKDAGGVVLVQDPATTAFDPMPRAAIASVAVDAIAAPDLLPARIAALAAAPAPSASPPPASGGADDLGRVLELLHRLTGHDLTQYKPATIARRVQRRVEAHRLASLEAYAAYLDANPAEAELLFRELMIGVTEFFRDDAAFVVLRDVALPAILAAKRPPRALRAWVAGCSTGEEAYSLAIVIHEVLARARARDVAVQIYATDIDAAAIAVARAGHYPATIAQQVSADRLARYFVADGRRLPDPQGDPRDRRVRPARRDRRSAVHAPRRPVLPEPPHLPAAPPAAGPAAPLPLRARAGRRPGPGRVGDRRPRRARVRADRREGPRVPPRSTSRTARSRPEAAAPPR